jgi:glycosyltransferase involved in cell wall biosynthesis
MSSGEYLAFLDSDDLWHPDKLTTLVQELDKRREDEKNIALICTSVWLIDDEGKLINSKPAGRQKKLEKFSYKDFFYRPRIFAPPSNAVFVKRFVEEIGGFDEDIRYGEDWALLIRLRRNYKFSYFDMPLTYFRVHQLNQQSFPKLDDIDQYLVDHLTIIKRSAKLVDNPELIKTIKAQIYEKIAYWYFSCNAWEEGMKELNRAISLNPQAGNKLTRVVGNIASSGKNNILVNKLNTVPEIINFFTQSFYPKLKSLWPTKLLSKKSIKRKASATFCHLLLCDQNVKKNRKDMLKLSCLSLKYFRYWRSLTTWKTIKNNLLPD